MEKTENKGIIARTLNWFNNLSVKGLLKTILVVFIIIVIILVAGRLPNVLSRISSSFSAALYSVFVPAEEASFNVNKKIISSGDDFTVTFKEGGEKVDGLFTVSYDCEQNINLIAIEPNGNKNISCDQPYYLLSGNTLTIRAVTTDDTVVRLALTGSLENNETQKSEVIGVARVTVTNKSAGTPATENPITKPTNIVNPSNLTPSFPGNTNYTGKADLAVRVLQVGLLNERNNIISNQTTFNYNDTVGIRFEVRNDGDAATGVWNFSTALPSMSNPSYVSPTQVSLRPGESIQFTLGFSDLRNQYSNLLTINVDPNNAVSEYNEGNNMITSTIINRGYNNDYYDDYRYNNYNYNSNQGCYINGWFTYDCNGRYDNNYNYYNDGADLEVEILAVGKINSSGNFVEDDEINEGDDAAVKFRVKNVGDDDSGRWDYEVHLKPAFSGDEIHKNNQASLEPGESKTITVQFNNIDDDGTQRFTVEVDPDDDINDDYRGNNDDTMSIDVN